MRIKQTLKAVSLVTAMLSGGCGVQHATVSDDTTLPAPTWEEFRAGAALKEPGTGVWIADGDTPFASEKLLREFYEQNVRQDGEVATSERGLIVNTVGGSDDAWSAAQRTQLKYCVSDTFGPRKVAVLAAMAQASQAWMDVADVKFLYTPSQDANCNASNSSVVFDVSPVNVGGQYIARAFFPSSPRSAREVLIDDSAFGTGKPFTLTGVLRHELGHTLGFRHEHTRPEAGTCFENNAWRALTPYDRDSVMHYPQCNGSGSWALELTARDEEGAIALYGPPGGSPGGTDAGTGGGSGGSDGGVPVGGVRVTQTVQGQVSFNELKVVSFEVVPETTVSVQLSNSAGDADLYVRFGEAPTLSTYHCRPYLNAPSGESCELDVPADARKVYVGVHGFSAATYSFDIAYTRTDGPPLPGGSCATAEALTVNGPQVQGTTRGYAQVTSPCSPTWNAARYYTFSLTQRSKVTLQFAAPASDTYDFALSGPTSGASCSSSTQASCDPTAWELAPGTYVLTLHGALTNLADYQLAVLAAPVVAPVPATGESCTAPLPLALVADRATAVGTTAGRTHDRTGTCGGALNDLVYSVTTTRPGVLKATVTATGATFRPVVYLQQSTCSTTGNLKCAAAPANGSAASFTTATLPAGTYFFWVDGVRSNGGTNGSFVLDVTLQ